MKVLVTGATGLIGSAICARLHAQGDTIFAVVRPGRNVAFMEGEIERIEIDIARAVHPEDWEPHLSGLDAVVNCAGVLQDDLRDSTHGVHAAGVAALFRACERIGVRKVIHFSAIGVDRGGLTGFSRSKLAGDQVLMQRALDWVILRPSVVVGQAAAGGSALLRGLAALPVLPEPPEAGSLQVVQLDDVVDTVMFFLAPEAPSGVALELAGPQRLGFTQVVGTYRSWLGWPPARRFHLPRFVFGLMFLLGDMAGLLGWRSPLRSTARQEIVRGAVGDPAPWQATTGIRPEALSDALMARPASIQEQWFSRMLLLKPLIIATFSVFWIGTGIISLGPGWTMGVALMETAGVGALAAPGVIAGALADIVVGLAIAWRPTARAGLLGAFALSAFYLVTGTVLMPVLWSDPIGPMFKILPIMALNLVALAIVDR